jgi:predicted HTH transcriptional regulator
MKKSAWTEDRVNGLVSGQVQESLSLEYKRAESLGPTEARRKEITKDVSAMANSAGGVIIYGIAEYESGERKRYPERVDPVSLRNVSREWVEQIINTIQPRILGVEIHAVPVGGAPDSVVVVVDIPRSTTAHQATDHKYYKRFNFLSQPMEDYEVRDVMNRAASPNV